ncbi:MAG: molybdenum cofactor guanylyltransferase [Synergistaceae bacterium]|jgi:molybdopterin-guanine dinucleotide biosynthesis protein A|nr:molybdenum cofactor guanylyltransferase [Synergistaceae bacterium]
MKATGIVLTGGKSRRFGSDKTRLSWGGKTLVERRVDQYAPLFDEILIVGSAPGKFSIPGVREVEDIFPEAGPLGGIHAGLFHAAYERVFVTACDMPFFDASLALRLLDLAREGDAAIPQQGTGTQPLFAVYCRSALPEIEKMLREEQRSVRLLYGRVRTKYLVYSEKENKKEAAPQENVSPVSSLRNPFFDVFFNINFPEDYRRLLETLEEFPTEHPLPQG